MSRQINECDLISGLVRALADRGITLSAPARADPTPGFFEAYKLLAHSGLAEYSLERRDAGFVHASAVVGCLLPSVSDRQHESPQRARLFFRPGRRRGPPLCVSGGATSTCRGAARSDRQSHLGPPDVGITSIERHHVGVNSIERAYR